MAWSVNREEIIDTALFGVGGIEAHRKAVQGFGHWMNQSYHAFRRTWLVQR